MSDPGAPRVLLRSLFETAVARVAGDAAVARALAEGRLPRTGRLFVLAAGKAAAAMAGALEAAAGARIAAGLVVTKDGHGQRLARFRTLEAGHPVPDARSEAAGRAALALAAEPGRDDVLVVLLSGGASALLTAPLPGLALADLAATTEALLAGGAPIEALNAVRKHLTAVSGGRLARASRAGAIVVLALSDVTEDDVAVIGSGPCAPDPSTWADALAALVRHGAGRAVPRAVRAHLEAGAAGQGDESAKPGDPVFERVESTVLANNADALHAAAEAARRRGLAVQVFEEELRGEAREVGVRLAETARKSAPGLILAGGETTVTLGGTGRGGRSQELALAAALALEGDGRVTLLAAGTDGSDGPTAAAGAFADGGSVQRGSLLGVDARESLARNDSNTFFATEGGLFTTGPTGTNVRDMVLLHIAEDEQAARSPIRGADRATPQSSRAKPGSAARLPRP